MHTLVIPDNENIWRSVSPEYVKDNGPNGPVLSSQAFNDPNFKPSVDIASIQQDPALTKKRVEHGVIALVTLEVRLIASVRKGPEHQPQQIHAVDVISDPVAGNDAHAQIQCTPGLSARSVFDRLKDALARIASNRPWICPPET